MRDWTPEEIDSVWRETVINYFRDQMKASTYPALAAAHLGSYPKPDASTLKALRLCALYFSGPEADKTSCKTQILALVPERWYRAMKEAVRDKAFLWQAVPKPKNSKEYPHKCPSCTGPAYVGFNMVDCLKGCRR